MGYVGSGVLALALGAALILLGQAFRSDWRGWGTGSSEWVGALHLNRRRHRNWRLFNEVICFIYGGALGLLGIYFVVRGI